MYPVFQACNDSNVAVLGPVSQNEMYVGSFINDLLEDSKNAPQPQGCFGMFQCLNVAVGTHCCEMNHTNVPRVIFTPFSSEYSKVKVLSPSATPSTNCASCSGCSQARRMTSVESP
eukprot:g20523.t1